MPLSHKSVIRSHALSLFSFHLFLVNLAPWPWSSYPRMQAKSRSETIQRLLYMKMTMIMTLLTIPAPFGRLASPLGLLWASFGTSVPLAVTEKILNMCVAGWHGYGK